MADEFTPTTEGVRLAYGSDEWGGLRDRWAAEFDRWLAAHDRATAARAWDEGYRTCDRAWEETADLTTPDEDRTDPRNPYRKEADR